MLDECVDDAWAPNIQICMSYIGSVPAWAVIPAVLGPQPREQRFGAKMDI